MSSSPANPEYGLRATPGIERTTYTGADVTGAVIASGIHNAPDFQPKPNSTHLIHTRDFAQGAVSVSPLDPEPAKSLDPRKRADASWLVSAVGGNSTVDGQTGNWGQNSVWGDDVVWGDAI